jgi:hypothetical protein
MNFPELLDRFMTYVLGRSWRTSIAGIIAAASSFVIFSPEHFNSTTITIAKFVCGGGLMMFGINAKDKQISGADRQIEPKEYR